MLTSYVINDSLSLGLGWHPFFDADYALIKKKRNKYKHARDMGLQSLFSDNWVPFR